MDALAKERTELSNLFSHETVTVLITDRQTVEGQSYNGHHNACLNHQTTIMPPFVRESGNQSHVIQLFATLLTWHGASVGKKTIEEDYILCLQSMFSHLKRRKRLANHFIYIITKHSKNRTQSVIGDYRSSQRVIIAGSPLLMPFVHRDDCVHTLALPLH